MEYSAVWLSWRGDCHRHSVVDTKCLALGPCAEEIWTEWRALGIDLSSSGTLGSHLIHIVEEVYVDICTVTGDGLVKGVLSPQGFN